MAELAFDDSAVAWRDVEGEIVAVDLRTSEYLTVNAVGRILWLEIAAGSDESGLVTTLVREADLAHARASQDVAAFLAPLRARGLVIERSE